MPSLQALNTAAKIALPLLSFAGFWGTWGIGFRTGFLKLIKERLTADNKLLPSAEVPLKLTYTWIPPVDALIRRLNVFLWPAIDGRWPGLSLVAWEFSGQFSATWMIAGLEGLRYGNRGKLVTFTTIVGLLSQTITYGTIVPLYLFFHLLYSPTSLGSNDTPRNSDPTVDLMVDPAETIAWPIAFTISYLLPTLLVSFPSPDFTSFTTRQIIMAFWELYPIPFRILQTLLVRYLSSYIAPSTKASSSNQHVKSQSSLRALRYVYAFAAIVGSATHVTTLTLSLSSKFFPSLFKAAAVGQLRPQLVLFTTASPLRTIPVKDMGEGLLHFLQYNMNVSNIAPVVWALIQCRNAFTATAKQEWGISDWLVCLTKVTGIYAFAGSGAATAWLMWQRDEMVLGEKEGKEKRK
ncbi:MAG: hypothetical protein LQ351_004952 [Letrouitia transgressa]|nr:MAG: hypothetical protein LQ351_004952 [Letrouitia transgressa]